MRAAITNHCTLFALVVVAQSLCHAETLVDSDFSKGSFAELGWTVQGDWDVYRYPSDSASNPGPVARFAANKPGGSLTKTFKEVANPKSLKLALDYGWGWGEADQGADMISFMLLDAQKNGYLIEIHRFTSTNSSGDGATRRFIYCETAPTKRETRASASSSQTTRREKPPFICTI